LLFTVGLAVAVHFKKLWMMFIFRAYNLAIGQSVWILLSPPPLSSTFPAHGFTCKFKKLIF
jgi:hypothetical protein